MILVHGGESPEDNDSIAENTLDPSISPRIPSNQSVPSFSLVAHSQGRNVNLPLPDIQSPDHSQEQ